MAELTVVLTAPDWRIDRLRESLDKPRVVSIAMTDIEHYHLRMTLPEETDD